MSDGNLIGQDRLSFLCNEALDASSADQTQISISVTESSLTRFANSVIHQNVCERNTSVMVKAVVGKRVGISETNRLATEAIGDAVRLAVATAKRLPEIDDYMGLPDLSPPIPKLQTYFESTAGFGPESRAESVRQIADITRDLVGAHVSGSFKTDVSETMVLNSNGLRAYAPSSSAGLVVVCESAEGVSYADAHSRDALRIDPEAVAREAAERCKTNIDPVSIEPGEYDVILLPYAVYDLLGDINYCGFGALAYQEGRSPLSGKLGSKIMGENINITDDTEYQEGFARPFDGEGVARQRVEIIKNGIAMTPVYDSYTASRENRESTGHGFGASVSVGPMALNLVLNPGDSTVNEMVASTKKGLLITRFHYSNILHEVQAIATGMTRDGTYLIEDGMISKPVKNLRYTESILNALSNVEMIGKDVKVFPFACVPALKIRGFRFTSSTEF